MKLSRFSPLLAVGAIALVGCNQTPPPTNPNEAPPAPASTSKPAESVRGYARALHLVPGMGPLSVVISGQKITENLSFGNASTFEGIAQQKIEVSAFGGGGKVSGPMPVTLDGGEDFTVLITGVPGDVALLPFKHKNHGPAGGKSKIAFVHAAKSLPAVDLKIDGESFRKAVKFSIATDYQVFAPGRHKMEVSFDRSLAPKVLVVEQPTVVTKDAAGNVVSVVSPTPAKTVIPQSQIVTLVQEMDMAADKVYSLAVYQDEKQLPKLKLLEDKFTPEMVRAQPAEE